MSTMLKTTNPEAVAEIEAEQPRDHRKPYVGQSVLFHGRPGEGRFGRAATPALVLSVEDEDHVELLIQYAADDALVRWKIARKTDQNPFNSWTFNEHDEKFYQPNPPAQIVVEAPKHLTAEDLKEMYAEIGELRSATRDLRKRIGELEKAEKRGAHKTT